MRRDDDDEIGLLLLIIGAAKQRAQHRHRADPRYLRNGTGVLRLQKTGNGEALTVAQFNRRTGIAHREGRNHRVLYDHRIGEIGFADRRLDPQVDDAVA